MTTLEAVKHVLSDLQPHTLFNIKDKVSVLCQKQVSETAISARIRDLRKPHHGGFRIESLPGKDSPGTWTYRMIESGCLL